MSLWAQPAGVVDITERTMFMIRKLMMAAAASSALLAGAVGGSGSAAAEPNYERYISSDVGTWKPDGLYKVAYSQELWEVNGAEDYAAAISYSDWASQGFPGFKPAPTDYVKYPWSPNIYAVTFFGSDQSQWLTDQLNYIEWQLVGFPAPRTAGLIPGSEFIQHDGSSEIFVQEPDDAAAFHKLTFPQWQAAGAPTPTDTDIQFKKLAWDTSGAIFVNYFEDYGNQIDFAQWQYWGFPTPQNVQRLEGDEAPSFGVTRESPGSSTLVYYNSFYDYENVLSFQEWQGAGAPPPAELPISD